MLKRLLDIILSALGLLLCAPLTGGIALCIWATLGRPILFRQRRPGLHERLFTLYKFRTMHPAGPDRRATTPHADARRLTPLGRFLRRTSLDELPGLVNILKGEMSLVGPRPLLPRYLPYYHSHERRRHDVRPGLTGWAQLHEHERPSWDRRLALDVWYVEHRSLWLDLRILARTVRAAFARRRVVDRPHLRFLDEVRAEDYRILEGDDTS